MLPTDQTAPQPLPHLLILHYPQPLGQGVGIALPRQEAGGGAADFGMFAVQRQQIDLGGIVRIQLLQGIQPGLAQSGIALMQQGFQHRFRGGRTQMCIRDSCTM